jgi:hypothetical protein
MLGYDRPLSWSYDAQEGLTISLPEELQEESNRPCRHAYAFKIEGTAVEGGA